MKPKTTAPTTDLCQSPPHAILPVLPYLSGVVWECAAGEGLLANSMREHGVPVVESEILLNGRDFFQYEPTEWDMIVTNPPFSMKYKWLERCYSLKKPFALLLPLESLGSQKAQRLFRENGLELIVLNKRINFKMPNKGWDGGGAQFPVAWFTWNMSVGKQISFYEFPVK